MRPPKRIPPILKAKSKVRRFIVLNQSPALMSMRYEVVGAGWGGIMQVGGRGSHVFVAARVGPLRFFVGDREVAYVRYERRSCYGWHDGYTIVVASRMYRPPVYMTRRPTVVVRQRPVIAAAPPAPPEANPAPARPRPHDNPPSKKDDDRKDEGRSAHRRP